MLESSQRTKYFFQINKIVQSFNIYVSIGRFRQCIDRLKSVVSVNFRIWSKYVG